MGKSYPTVGDEYKKAIDKCRKKLRGLIAKKNCAPLMLRIAWPVLLLLKLLVDLKSPSILEESVYPCGYDMNKREWYAFIIMREPTCSPLGRTSRILLPPPKDA
ncbi:hypothetical protein SAY86_001751 [Trapa natans]|uniref:Uncharacterized protein n=1 Tax=Trapa natans TaxID=22666 RepID=A0AAN7LSQ8_TRANT|nr:hypothetical protein SAY86_001751 [Trapa natans]